MSETVFPKIFAKDLSNLFTLVAWAANTQIHGTYSMRHPNLGKMRKCPHCGKRRREFGARCCNVTYTKTMKKRDPEKGIIEIEVPERVTDAIISKAALKRMLSGRGRQYGRFAHPIAQQAKLFQESDELVKAAAKEMHVIVPKPEHIPAFAEKYWLWKRERSSRAVRRQQRRSRAINER